MIEPTLPPNGATIRQLRQAMGWSQEELAEQVGFHKRTIEKAEKAEAGARIRKRYLERIADKLGTTLDAITGTASATKRFGEKLEPTTANGGSQVNAETQDAADAYLAGMMKPAIQTGPILLPEWHAQIDRHHGGRIPSGDYRVERLTCSVESLFTRRGS
jgi:transcriptional regulator with XRE-family HTH domain